MDDIQLYSALIELKLPWKVEKVSLDSVKKTVNVYIIHEKGSKCTVYRTLRQIVKIIMRQISPFHLLFFLSYFFPPSLQAEVPGHPCNTALALGNAVRSVSSSC